MVRTVSLLMSSRDYPVTTERLERAADVKVRAEFPEVRHTKYIYHEELGRVTLDERMYRVTVATDVE